MIVFLGTVTGIHGVRGEVELAFRDDCYFASLPLIEAGISVYIDKEPLYITKVKRKPRAFVFSFENIDSVEKASMLIGRDVYVDTEILPKLDKNTFYEAELIGFKVVDKCGKLYANVIDCYNLPSNSVLVLKLIENENTVSIPFVSKYFGDADKENKIIEIIEKPFYE